jgi:C4-type Zn-finger protein
MAFLELTDKPCPSCGAHLDLHVERRDVPVDDPLKTKPVVRMLVCPECGHREEDAPPGVRGGAS